MDAQPQDDASFVAGLDGEEGLFPNYEGSTQDTQAAFVTFVVMYTVAAICCIGPCVVSLQWSSTSSKNVRSILNHKEGEDETEKKESSKQEKEDEPEPTRAQDEVQQQDKTSSSSDEVKQADRKGPLQEQQEEPVREEQPQRKRRPSQTVSTTTTSQVSGFSRMLQNVSNSNYLDQDPLFQSRISSRRSRKRNKTSSSDPQSQSDVPSAATTSMLAAVRPQDVSRRRWKHRRPIGRVDVISRNIHSQRQIHKDLVPPTRNPLGRAVHQGGMSDVASHILHEQTRGLDMDSYTLNTQATQQHSQHPQSRFIRKTVSIKSTSDYSYANSMMSSIVDDIRPDDAADADDPGQGNVFTSQTMMQQEEHSNCMLSKLESTLLLAEPDDEVWTVLKLSLPLTCGAMLEPLCTSITIGVVGHSLHSAEALAMVLVILWVQGTSQELIVGAIVDALASWLSTLLYSTPTSSSSEQRTAAQQLAGQYIQMALLLQLLVGIPVLIFWVYLMDDLVLWLFHNDELAQLARDYTQIIVYRSMVQSLSRTWTVLFHLGGHEHFESTIDAISLILGLIAVVCVATLVEDATLTTIAYTQLFVSAAVAVTKVTFPLVRGWSKSIVQHVFRCGRIQDQPSILKNLIIASLPLSVGTLLEFSVWPLLTLCCKQMGAAQAAAWAILGVTVWEVLTALTEGLGEAASIRLAFSFGSGRPDVAQTLSRKVLYLALVQGVLVTALLYLFGRLIAAGLSAEPVLQHLLYNALPLLGLANIALNLSQAGWSVVGAQGRFRLATLLVWTCTWCVAIPMALVAVFGFELDDVSALAGSLAVGYASASSALTYVVLRSDWMRISQSLLELNPTTSHACGGGDEDEDDDDYGHNLLDFLDDDFDASDSSEGFG